MYPKVWSVSYLPTYVNVFILSSLVVQLRELKMAYFREIENRVHLRNHKTYDHDVFKNNSNNGIDYDFEIK